MKKVWIGLLVLLLTLSWTIALADNLAPIGNPPGKPAGDAPMGTPPVGSMPGGGPGVGPGGQSAKPETYASVVEITEDTVLDDETYLSAGSDENALHVSSGALILDGASVSRVSADSTGGDAASFYGVGAAILATGGTATIQNCKINTDASGGAGVFAYGDAVVYVSDTVIQTLQDTSGGVHVAGGGTLYAKNLSVETNGDSAAAIRSDRGGGTLVADGGNYLSNGSGSPAVYVTADVSIRDASLTATNSEALCLEGLNTVRLYNCALSGAMPDLPQNDNTWTVILYQSMSGDAEIGEGRFEMDGGTLSSTNGGLFYTTNTESEFVLSNVAIDAPVTCPYFLRCTGNANQRGWGSVGANGARCKFTAIAQQMKGDVVWDSISQLDLYAIDGSVLTGAVINDESCAGNGGDGYCNIELDKTSTWVVTGDSRLAKLANEGCVEDADGRAVSIVGTDGTVYVQGESAYTVTVAAYATVADWAGLGATTQFDETTAQ